MIGVAAGVVARDEAAVVVALVGGIDGGFEGLFGTPLSASPIFGRSLMSGPLNYSHKRSVQTLGRSNE